MDERNIRNIRNIRHIRHLALNYLMLWQPLIRKNLSDLIRKNLSDPYCLDARNIHGKDIEFHFFQLLRKVYQKLVNVMNFYQRMSNETGFEVYLVYTATADNSFRPTTSYKHFRPLSKVLKVYHQCKDLQSLETLLFKVHTKAMIFFARMGKRIVHIDPWPINANELFGDSGKRNSNSAIFPESRYGDCLSNAVLAEKTRKSCKNKV